MFTSISTGFHITTDPGTLGPSEKAGWQSRQVCSQGSSPAHLLWSRASFHETQTFQWVWAKQTLERWRFPPLLLDVKSLCIHVINSELRFGEQALKRYIELRPKGCENGWIWLDSSSCPFNHELTNFIWFFKVLKHPNQLKPPKSLIKTPHGSAHKWDQKKSTFHGFFHIFPRKKIPKQSWVPPSKTPTAAPHQGARLRTAARRCISCSPPLLRSSSVTPGGRTSAGDQPKGSKFLRCLIGIWSSVEIGVCVLWISRHFMTFLYLENCLVHRWTIKKWRLLWKPWPTVKWMI